jgi:hypothetical protein
MVYMEVYMTKSPWYAKLTPLKRDDLKIDALLEYREAALNQRLIDKYYDQQRSELRGQIIELQRIDRPQPRK